jgi:hypothetical protein
MTGRHLMVMFIAPLVGLVWLAAPTAHAQTRLPFSILDLTDWKLTLPVEAPGSETAREVKQPELHSFSDRFFRVRVDPTGSGVVFTAPVEGATTTGSSYPRSELREMTNGGTENASWSTTDDVHTMTVNEAVTELPPAKPQVVCAQMWGPTTDLIEIVADGKNPRQPGTVKLAVRFQGTSQSTLLDPTYVPGHRFAVGLVAAHGTVRVTYNGETKLVFEVSTSGMYFKAGAYTQSNPSKGDEPPAIGQVVIYALHVTHSD